MKMLIPLALLILAAMFTHGLAFACMLPWVALSAWVAWEW